MEKKYESLKKWNLIMAGLHLVQAVAIFFLSNDSTLPITTNYLDGSGFGSTALEKVGDLRIGVFVALFSLISALAHFSIATFGYSKYKKDLSNGMNLARWYEYGISSSIMIVLIAMLSGIFDLGSLVLIFFLNASMIFFGYDMEVLNQGLEKKKVDWRPFIFGSVAGIVPWIVISMYFFSALGNSGDGVPTFVYYILGSLFIFFNSFAFNMFLQYKKIGPWKDYLFGERVYITLSLVAKSALAWQVFGGTLR